MSHVLPLSAAVLLVNLPFGYWRGGARKFSRPWFLAVHAPVPLVVGLRLLAGVHWSLATGPFLVAGYFGGQALGARFRGRRRGRQAVGSGPAGPSGSVAARTGEPGPGDAPRVVDPGTAG